MGGGRLVGQVDEPGGGGVGLEATVPPAGAQPAAVPDDHVPELGGGVVVAGEDLAREHHPAAHAGAERDDDRAGSAPGAAGVHLAEGGDVCVVAHRDGQSQRLAEVAAHRVIAPAEVVGVLHDAGFGVDGAGTAHADPPHLRKVQPGRMERVPGGPDDVGAHLVRGTGQRGRQAPLPEDGAALRIHDPHLDVGPAQIDAYVIHRISSYTVVSSSSPFPVRAKPGASAGTKRLSPARSGNSSPPQESAAPPSVQSTETKESPVISRR